MNTSLDKLITEHWNTLVDQITKDSIRRIPSYTEAPLRLTIERIERALRVLGESIAQNEPPILAQHLMAVAEERKEEGYPIGDLHIVIQIFERHLGDLIDQTVADPVEQTGQRALLRAVMDSARMTLSVTYILSKAAKEP